MVDEKLLNSINQNRHFDFDAPILANKVFNTFMVKWASVVRDTLLLDVREMIGNEMTDETMRELQSRWLNRLFQRGKVNMILEKFKKVVDNKVLAIPSNFILYEDQDNAELRKDEAIDEQRQLETIRATRAYILQLRIEIATLKKLQDLQMCN